MTILLQIKQFNTIFISIFPIIFYALVKAASTSKNSSLQKLNSATSLRDFFFGPDRYEVRPKDLSEYNI